MSRTDDFVAAHGGSPRSLVALTEGFQSAFAVSIVFPVAEAASQLE